MSSCQLVCTEAGGWVGAVCCLRWCASVQSGTVSVQPHPWSGLVVVSTLFCDPPAPPSGWGAESLSLSVSEVSSLLRTGGSQFLISHGPKDNPEPSHPSLFSYTLLSDSLQNPLCSTDSLPTCVYCSQIFVTFLMNPISNCIFQLLYVPNSGS